jgi:flavin reductase (DIM6/NTAB) family NADH-FMN oxidoreductase RutF
MQKEVPFAIALESRFPEQVAIAVVRDPQGRYNPITLGWVTPVSLQPPLLAMAVGRERYTVEALRLSREFVLAFPSEAQAEAAKYFGSHSGRDSHKLAAVKCENERAHKVDSRLLTEAVSNFECKLVREVEAGDHILFIGEVVACHVHANPASRLYTLIKSQHMGGFRQK